MSCSGCSIDMNGAPKGCQSKGHCSTGRCNKMNTYDWFSKLEIHDPMDYQVQEISFKNGARKDFYFSNPSADAVTGDLVVVEANGGYDIGRITLSGELVRMQMRKKNVSHDRIMNSVIRKANERDLERMEEARAREHKTMVKARSIARMLDLEMKIGDVEFQADNKKATFYYTADGRVDFRELVRMYASEFRIKIEMRQIGSRQESARIGGFGPCGRELCCSTWLSDFKSVTTSAARYQNLAINQTKLSGQCGRLKCCLNYELDSYLDALKSFPKNADFIYTQQGKYELVKTDIFKGIMFYLQILELGRGAIIPVPRERVAEIVILNKKGQKPDELLSGEYETIAAKSDEYDYEDVTGHIELPPSRSSRKWKKSRKKGKGNRTENSNNQSGGANEPNSSNRPDRQNSGNRDQGGQKVQSNKKWRKFKKKKNSPPDKRN